LARRYVYGWANEVYFSSRMDHDKQCALVKDREQLPTFYGFPAEHWKHILDNNPIGRTFATVRQRTLETNHCLGRKTARAMDFELILSAKPKWRKFDGSNQFTDCFEGVPFKDGIKQTRYS
jgi:putative transposase